MLLAFLLPATFGAVAVAKPLYTVFYGQPDGLALGLFIVAMLQTVILGLLHGLIANDSSSFKIARPFATSFMV